MRGRAGVLQIGERACARQLQRGALGSACGLSRVEHAFRRRTRLLRGLLLILDGFAFPAASHVPYFPCASARFSGAIAIRSGCASTCAFTMASAFATASASPARNTLLASTSVFCDAGVESTLS